MGMFGRDNCSWSFLRLFACLGLVLVVPNGAGQARTIRRLQPSEFKELPLAFAQRLTARGCTIPQTRGKDQKGPVNVIHGEFAQHGQTDWAVLCSARGRSVILIFWGGPTRCPDEVENLPDGNGRFIFPAKEIDNSMDEPIQRPITHQGIGDAWVDKGSKINFCEKGQWLVPDVYD